MTAKLHIWKEELKDDPDKDFILTGIEHGFRITDQDSVFQSVDRDNYRSATNPDIRDTVESQILMEIAEGNYRICVNKPTIVSSLGAIPKPNSDKIRLIHDCSQPSDKAVNTFATTEKFSYQTFEEAVRLLTPNCFMAKVDLQSAYRSCALHPDCYPATGLKWKFKGHNKPTYLYDTKLLFGSARAPSIFSRITQSVRRMMARRGISAIVCYLDDFFIVASTHEECQRAMNMLIALLRRLGFFISWSKVEGPTHVITFLGIRIDSHTMTLALPQDKLAKTRTILDGFAARTRASRRQLQSLAGKLNWCCQVIAGGRAYLRRILDTMNTLKQPHHKARLTKEFHADILWWRTFLSVFNGTQSCLTPYSTITLQVDSSTTGAGMFMEGDWAYCHWATDMPNIADLHINHKETITIVLAARRWAHLWTNKTVNVHTDSITAKAAINKGHSKCKHIMPYLRELVWLSALFNFKVRAYHISGTKNTLADNISRLSYSGFLAKTADILLPGCAPTTVIHTLPLHMSNGAFLFLLPQVQRFLQKRQTWMQ